MKIKLFVLILIIAPLLLIACTDEEEDHNALIKKQIPIEEVSHIDIEIDTHKKSISHDQNINLLFNYINNIQVLDNDAIDNTNLDAYERIRLKLYDNIGNGIETISIGRGVVFYNGTWYTTNPRVYDEIAQFYESLDYEVVENERLVEINHRISNRIELPLDEGLKGTWLSIEGSNVTFDNKLIQGDQTKYRFDYKINSINESNLNITVYGEEGFFLGGKELSTMEITMDSTKSLMKMKRIMTGGKTYYDKLIYVDEDGLPLGFFDSYFFYEGL